MTSIIRPFKSQDMDQVLTIWQDASVQAHDFMPKEFWTSRVEDMRTVYLPASETWVYEKNEMVSGFFSLCRETLACLFVAPQAQGRGIGGELMEKAMTLRTSLNLTVYRKNRRSVAFYRRWGFEVVREQKDPHTGWPELVMRLGPPPSSQKELRG